MAGNNKFDAVFDAPLGEKIMATSSKVTCDLAYNDGTASGTCKVPLTSIDVDSEPTKTEHFHQWATNKKLDPKKCNIVAKFEGVRLSGPIAAAPAAFSGESAFTVCGKARSDGGKEKVVGNAMLLPDGRIRIRARVDKLNRDQYRIGPKYTEGWLARVQRLAKVVAEKGTVELLLFAKSQAEEKAASAR
jgi:hypothetical protein